MKRCKITNLLVLEALSIAKHDAVTLIFCYSSYGESIEGEWDKKNSHRIKITALKFKWRQLRQGRISRLSLSRKKFQVFRKCCGGSLTNLRRFWSWEEYRLSYKDKEMAIWLVILAVRFCYKTTTTTTTTTTTKRKIKILSRERNALLAITKTGKKKPTDTTAHPNCITETL